MKKLKIIFSLIFIIFLASIINSCIAGAGFDSRKYINEIENFNNFISNKIIISYDTVPYYTFKQEFDEVFDDFPYSGKPIIHSETKIQNTPYELSYYNFILAVKKNNTIIVERKLPKAFYMHRMTSGVLLNENTNKDILIFRIMSRATTGKSYICIIYGNGEILLEKIFDSREDWEIFLKDNKNIIIGGTCTKTSIKFKN